MDGITVCFALLFLVPHQFRGHVAACFFLQVYITNNGPKDGLTTSATWRLRNFIATLKGAGWEFPVMPGGL